MIVEGDFYDPEADRFKFDRTLIDEVAFPLGDRYPQEIFERYFYDYSGMAHKFKPRRILEIGVRYGYTGIAFCLGVRGDKGRADVEYLGVDDESYHVGSCDRANANFAQVVPWASARAIKWNSFSGLPPNVGTFDLAHVDGNHDVHGVLNDLGIVWPVINPGGFVLLDDTYFPQIRKAIDTWLEAMDVDEEVIEAQFINNERGHCYLKRAGTKVAEK